MNYSRQRESIKNFLACRTDHPTADTIYQHMRQEYPNISLGTVYRNLALLSEIGEIVKLNLDDGSDHYDFDTTPHHHFICSKCGSVQDIYMDEMKPLVNKAQSLSLARIEKCYIHFVGTCKECIEKEDISLT